MHPHNNSGHDAKFLSWAVSILCSGVPLLERSLISCLLSFAPGAMVANQSSARQVMRSIRSSKSDASYPVRCYPEALSWSVILKCCPEVLSWSAILTIIGGPSTTCRQVGESQPVLLGSKSSASEPVSVPAGTLVEQVTVLLYSSPVQGHRWQHNNPEEKYLKIKDESISGHLSTFQLMDKGRASQWWCWEFQWEIQCCQSCFAKKNQVDSHSASLWIFSKSALFSGDLGGFGVVCHVVINKWWWSPPPGSTLP